MKKLVHLMIALVILACATGTANAQWKKLIGKDLGNFEQLNGSAPFKLKKGTITGTTVLNSPNSFLCTKEKYGDFILEFDTWFDPNMNSGVQIRSESSRDYQDGRVHGYQVEMDPSSRAWSGGIYDEARRGWLYTLDNNPAGQKALKAGGWNHYRIEAIGNSIRTWINGVPCADLVDDMTASGFIALQVHSIGKDSTRVGEEVKWKNIKIITENAAKYATPYTPAIPQYSYLNNVLTEREKQEGWKLLFDGKSADAWMNAKTGTFPSKGWVIKDGNLNVIAKGSGGDIVTRDKFKNFELIVDFKYVPGANSGIKYFIDTERDNGKYAGVGCEYQVLDDRLHPDAKAGKNGNRKLSSLYDLIPAKNVRDNGANQWNRAVIIVKGNKVQHWLNGQLTVEYERGSEQWKQAVAESKFKGIPGFGMVQEGRILLQEHGNDVSYKNIKIKVLD